ncbi:MAG: ArsR/SmtB family transcription factor [Candidatus Krumholzibacteriia bacterium]
MKHCRRKNTITADARQRRALSSPIRLEVIGQFTSRGGMSIADVAERMGRTPASLYYHFRVLENVGLLHKVGSRPGVKRNETLYEPVASRIEFPAGRSQADVLGAVKAMSSAFRMAERDLEDAIRTRSGRRSGKHRNFFATRMHCRITKQVLAEINEHVRAIEKILTREIHRKTVPANADQYCSLTLALLPLRGREKK